VRSVSLLDVSQDQGTGRDRAHLAEAVAGRNASSGERRISISSRPTTGQ
jgi:hypothetical protein